MFMARIRLWGPTRSAPLVSPPANQWRPVGLEVEGAELAVVDHDGGSPLLDWTFPSDAPPTLPVTALDRPVGVVEANS